MTDVTERLVTFSDGLNQVISDLAHMSEKARMPAVNTAYQSIGLNTTGRATASFLAQAMTVAMKDAFVYSLGTLSGDRGSTETLHELIRICILTAATEDTELAWELFQYVLYKHAYFLTQTAEYETLAETQITRMATHMIENHRGLYGDYYRQGDVTYEDGGRENIKFGSGNESLTAIIDGGV